MDMVIYTQRKEMNRRPPPPPRIPEPKKTFEYAINDLLKFDGDWEQVTTFWLSSWCGSLSIGRRVSTFIAL